MNYDVFISYHTKSAINIATAICNELESKKIKCWYAPRDTVDAYAGNITEVINHCKIFLLILNFESSHSFDVLNEINIACERLRRNEPIHIIPFQIDDKEVSPDAKYYIGRFHWIDALTPPIEKRIKELSDRISFLLSGNTTPKKDTLSINYQLKSTPIFSNPEFVGRENELNQIEEQLNQYDRVFLYGMGGIGKSEIAKVYAKKHKSDYQTIIFATYEKSIMNTILNDKFFHIENFSRKLDSNGVEESNEEFFERKLQEIKNQSSDKTLIIMDNFDTDNDPHLQTLLEGNYKIIFTTRNDLKALKLPIIHIQPIDNKEQLLQVFKNAYDIFIKPEDLPIIEEIIEQVKGHTLAIQLIASVMKEVRIKPAKMLEDLKSQGIRPDMDGEVLYSFNNYDSIYSCISLLFDLSVLTTQEKNILINLYFFPISGYGFEDFMELCQLESGKDINKLIKHSFITYDYISDTISLHPLIATIVKNELKPNLSNCHTLIENVANSYVWGLPIDEKEKFASIAYSIYNKFPDFTISEAKIYLAFSYFFRDINDFETSEIILFKVLEQIQNEDSKIELNIATLYKDIEYLYYKKYDFKKTEEYILKIIDIARNTDDKELLIEGLQKLAALYIDKNEAKKAKTALDEAYSIYKDNSFSSNDLLYFMFLYYAKIYYLLHDYDKALFYANSCYEPMEKNSETDTSSTSTSVSKILGQIYIELKDYNKAIENLKNSVEIREKYLNPKDIGLLRSKEALADAYMGNKEYEKANAILTEIKSIIESNYFNSNTWYNTILSKIKECTEKLTS